MGIIGDGIAGSDGFVATSERSGPLMLAKPSNLLFLALLLAARCGTAWSQSSDHAPVLPPPGSGLSVPLAGKLVFDPPPSLLVEPREMDGLLEESFAEALEIGPIVSGVLPQWYEPAYWFGPAPWDMGIEFGLNGSDGVKKSLSLSTGGHLKRKTRRWKIDSSLTYNKNTANGAETQHNGLVDLRVDRRMYESPWSLYFLHQTLYDEFQAYDLRVSLNEGIGYELIDTETIDLVGRFGAGTSREFGGPDNQWAPEALLGLEYEHALSKLQRLSAKADYYPQWDDFNQWRVVSDVGWEIDLDQPQHLSLKISVVDRYDSTPNGVAPNELNYAVLLIWSL